MPMIPPLQSDEKLSLRMAGRLRRSSVLIDQIYVRGPAETMLRLMELLKRKK